MQICVELGPIKRVCLCRVDWRAAFTALFTIINMHRTLCIVVSCIIKRPASGLIEGITALQIKVKNAYNHNKLQKFPEITTYPNFNPHLSLIAPFYY